MSVLPNVYNVSSAESIDPKDFPKHGILKFSQTVSLVSLSIAESAIDTRVKENIRVRISNSLSKMMGDGRPYYIEQSRFFETPPDITSYIIYQYVKVMIAKFEFTDNDEYFFREYKPLEPAPVGITFDQKLRMYKRTDGVIRTDKRVYGTQEGEIDSRFPIPQSLEGALRASYEVGKPPEQNFSKEVYKQKPVNPVEELQRVVETTPRKSLLDGSFTSPLPSEVDYKLVPERPVSWRRFPQFVWPDPEASFSFDTVASISNYVDIPNLFVEATYEKTNEEVKKLECPGFQSKKLQDVKEDKPDDTNNNEIKNNEWFYPEF